MEDSKFNVDSSDDIHQKEMQMIDLSGVTAKDEFDKEVALTEIQDLNGAEGNHKQDFPELQVLTIRINELAADMIKREISLKADELATKKEEIASITASFEKEIAELHKQIDEMKATNIKNQSLIGALSSLVAEQEMQLKDLKEVIGSKEHIITSFAVSLENSKKEIAELYKQVDEMKATDENKETLVGENNEKLDSLSGLLTNQQSETQAEENSMLETESNAKEESSALKTESDAKKGNPELKEDRKAQMKKLKKLLKMNPNTNEKVISELLGVDSSYIIGLRKDFDI